MLNTLEAHVASGELQHFVDFTRKYQESPDLRARADVEPRAVLSEHGIQVPPGQDVRIAANTAETYNFVMPPDPNAVLADEDLVVVAGGRGSDPKTASCIISCIMTFS